MAGEYACVMRDLRKVVPTRREILRGIRLSCFDGAKIGVLGANGAGKSTLLRIMAGVDRDFVGEAFPAEGLRIGYLQQEPQLDPGKDVRGNIEEGVAGARAPPPRLAEGGARRPAAPPGAPNAKGRPPHERPPHTDDGAEATELHP